MEPNGTKPHIIILGNTKKNVMLKSIRQNTDILHPTKTDIFLVIKKFGEQSSKIFKKKKKKNFLFSFWKMVGA